MAKLKGEDKWMLPELDAKLSGVKSKKSKKEKKEKKKKSKKHKKVRNSDSSDSDEWVEKTSDTQTTDQAKIVPLKREDWMSVPSHLPTFSKVDLTGPKRKSVGIEEENARKLMMEKPGQTSRELNPYWKDGGTGLPPEKSEGTEENEIKSSNRSRSRSRERQTSAKVGGTAFPEKKRFKRPSESENHLSIPSRGSVKSNPSWKKSDEKAARRRSSSSSSFSESDEEAPTNKELTVVDKKVWTEQELNALNAKIIKAEIMGQQVLSLIYNIIVRY